MKTKFKKATHWMAKNIATTVFCFVVIALGTAIVASATVTGTTIGNSISTEGLTANTATIGTLNGILKGASGTVGTATAGTDYEGPISAGTSGQYWRYDKTWADLNQAAVAGLTTASSPVFAGLTAGGATGVAIGNGTISDPTGAISFGSNSLSTSGTISSTGSNERVQGTDSFIDFNDGGSGFVDIGSIKSGGYNESLRFDFETTNNKAIITSPSSASITFQDMFLVLQDDISSDFYLATYKNDSSFSSDIVFRHSADTDTSNGYNTIETADTYVLGKLNFQGVTSSSGFYTAAMIAATQVGASGADNVASKIDFKTSTASGATATRLTITENGGVIFVPTTVSALTACGSGNKGTTAYISFENSLCFCNGTNYVRTDDGTTCTDS